jgi:hypothetical protein
MATRCISPPDSVVAFVAELVGDLQDLSHRAHLLLDLIGRSAQQRRLERKGQIFAHRQMRIKRVLLEHHRHVALRRRQAGHRLAADRDVSAITRIKPRDHPQCRGLARPGGAQQHHEGSVRHGQGYLIQRDVAAIAFADGVERNFSHGSAPFH